MAKKRPAPSKVKVSGSRSPSLPAEWIGRQKEKLEAHREQLRREISAETEQLKVFGTPDPREDADIAEETWEDEEVTRTVEVLQARFRQIEEALERIRSGACGVCIDCKRAIPRERLEAVPSAIRCVSCQEKHEAKTARPPKP